ncbi:NUDIX hydrolase [Metabacillus iocasae]|uniref:8-oxo-dGTP diphosphatase n=1 Tax=Priestia iocasae TaxID=2291674 RepID=A0ABS2QTS8_9BACI|nr:NUDIX hydrolase [Metabacillus iocasae]MBM7702883.1 8-oxo-dGTP diphosphatase [Metabacillus iocasae]
MNRVDVAYAFLYREVDQKILVVQNESGKWSLPGGAVEEGEPLKQAVVREAKEETGLTVEVEDLLSVNEAFFTESGHHLLFFTFQARIIDGEIEIQRPDEILQIEWVDIQTANERMPYHKDGIQGLLDRKNMYTLQK